MTLKLTETGENGLMKEVAKVTRTKIKDGVLLLPKTVGKGYMRYIESGPAIKIMIHDLELATDVLFRRAPYRFGKDGITFSFRNVFFSGGKSKPGVSFATQSARKLPAVQVSSPHMNFEKLLPAKTKVNNIIIRVHVDLLKDLLGQGKGYAMLQQIISGHQPFLYEEIILPDIYDVAAKIVGVDMQLPLRDYYLKLRAEEMVFLFFAELVKRDKLSGRPINVQDAKKMYAVREMIMADLSTPPNLPSLARFSGMCESKLKRLFKQIFGSSIYNYYQKLRIREAAFLLKTEKLSVSEAGYRMGFTNLSHFTRVFERHMGIKPKKYSLA